MSEQIINNVKIVDNGNGLSSFSVIDIPKLDDNIKQQTSVWQSIKSFFSQLSFYSKIRDLSDPFSERKNNIFDRDVGSDGKIGAEIGIKIKF